MFNMAQFLFAEENENKIKGTKTCYTSGRLLSVIALMAVIMYVQVAFKHSFECNKVLCLWLYVSVAPFPHSIQTSMNVCIGTRIIKTSTLNMSIAVTFSFHTAKMCSSGVPIIICAKFCIIMY